MSGFLFGEGDKWRSIKAKRNFNAQEFTNLDSSMSEMCLYNTKVADKVYQT